eukprot:gene22827-29002_t
MSQSEIYKALMDDLDTTIHKQLRESSSSSGAGGDKKQ